MPLKSDRLYAFLTAVSNGKRAIKTVQDARLFLEAVCNEENRTRCIERMVASSHGIEALGSSVRYDASITFMNEAVVAFLEYIADESLKQLHSGQLLRDVLLAVVEPPTFWNAFEKHYMQKNLSLTASRYFAWLLHELLTSPSVFVHLPVVQTAQKVKDSFLNSTDTETRSIGYKVQHILRGISSGSILSGSTKPGGRHDNDFEDFREIAIFPTADELVAKEQPFYLQADAVQEIDEDKRPAAHLDNQFRLLREEMLGELRTDIQSARSGKQGKRISMRLRSLVFHKIEYGNDKRRPASIALRCYEGIPIPPGNQDDRKQYWTTNKTVLRHESFGCLLCCSEIIAFATIDRNEDLLAEAPPIVLLRVFGDSAILKTLVSLKANHQRDLEFVLVDTPFFAYEPILRSLQEKTSIPLSTELLGKIENGNTRKSPLCPGNLIAQISQCEGQNLRNILGLEKDVILDHSQTESLIAGLRQAVSLIQGPPGTGKSFLGALLAKSLLENTSETILVICYTNHALHQFLEDILDIGVPRDMFLRLGSKYTPATKSLGLYEQSTDYRRSKSSWELLNRYESMVDVISHSLQEKSLAFRHLKVSNKDLLEFLQFSETDSEFYEAFAIPDDNNDGMVIVGRGGRAIDSSYLIDRWVMGHDAGIFTKAVQNKHQEIWSMNKTARSESLRRWNREFYVEQATMLQDSIQRHDAAFERFRIVRDQKWAEIIQRKRIIGCTTSAAAKYRKELQNAEPGIVLVEEAGEILESHILTSLAAKTKHLVLIGDHLQLRPKVNNYNLTIEKGEGYDLNRSLFERLVISGYPHTTLAKQHRMRPEISALVRSLMYPDLQDDAKTSDRPDIRGLQSSVVFFNHANLEVEFNSISDRRDEGSKSSRQNLFEADVVLKIVRYLAQQGYGSDNQVVLTPYLGQLRLLLQRLSADHDPVLNDLDSFDLVRAGLMPPASAHVGKKKLRISTIDNYQGEESDIVIASLTRSNKNGDIGFMAAPQRLNVLLSRARNGLIIIGNADTFVASKKGRRIWSPFIEQLGQANQLFDGLPVKCERHPEKLVVLKTKDDFDSQCPDGGCSESCQALLNCGKHSCPQRCHQLSDHSKIRCEQILKKTCPQGHNYSWRCWQRSSVCKKCEAEAAELEAQRERDHQLDLQRQARERAYAKKLAELDAEIAGERRLQTERAEDEERDRILQQRQSDLTAARQATKRSLAMTNSSGTAATTTGNEMKASQSPVESKVALESNRPSVAEQSDTSPTKTSQAATDWDYQKTHEMVKNEHLDALMGMIGLESVKQQFLDIKTKIDTCIRQNASLKRERFGTTLLGNPGTGKTTVARLYAQFLASVGVLPGSKVIETTGARLASNGVQACEKLIQEILNTGGGSIFIDEAYQLASSSNPGGGAVLDFLLAEVENLTGKVVFILAGYNKPMEKFFAHNPGLPSRFPHEFKFEDYDDEELRQIFRSKVNEQYGGLMKVEQGLDGLFCRIAARRIGYTRGHEGFGNAREVEKAFAKVQSRQAKRLKHERRRGNTPDDFLFTREDLIGPEPSTVLEQNVAWKKLNSLIGMSSVKQTIKALFDTIKHNYQRELEEKPLLQFNLNKVFLGSPGTGKTTVAKLYGKILADIGFLSNGEVVVKNPSDFVGDVLGASEKLTKGILTSTIGKVLVIDEAYGLSSSSSGGGGSNASMADPYKTAVIDTIVAEVQSVPGDDRCVILIGYRDQMEAMFQGANPGLSRRFPLNQAFEFEDFTNEELKEVLNLKLKEQAYKATDQAKSVAMDVLKRARNQKNFGNAGEVDNLLNTAKARHQKRYSTGATRDPSTLEAVDMDPDFDRGERAVTNVKMLFQGEIGRKEIIDRFEGYQRIVANMTARGDDPREVIPFRFLFKGPPGTGKTTTARKIGKIYYDMGFLSTASVVEISATDLVGEYVGHTGPKTQKQLEKALGKVLFIDEAYRLADGHFAKEAMDEIVDCLTKPAFAQKLIVILAGYDADINRLMSINPGLTSRFPETIEFQSIDSMQCLNLLTKQLEKKKHLDIGILNPPAADFQQDILHRFNTLIGSSNWGNARDVGLLTTSIYGALLKIADPKSTKAIPVDQNAILFALDSMIKERTGRDRTVGSIASGMPDLPIQSANPQTPLISSPSVQVPVTCGAAVSETEQDHSPENIVSEAEEPSNVPEAPVKPDLGVSQEIWTRLLLDIQIAVAAEREFHDLEAEFEKTQKEADRIEQEVCEQHRVHNEESQDRRLTPEQEEAKRRFEQERLQREIQRRKYLEKLQRLEREKKRAEEERKKEQAAQRKLRHMGTCIVGYRWIKQSGGYRCAGGSHFVSDAQLESS